MIFPFTESKSPSTSSSTLVKTTNNMSAAGIIVLILFFIGCGVALYYATLCLLLRSDKEKSYNKNPDMGPLLRHDPDLNGNEDDQQPPEVVVEGREVPSAPVDTPDLRKTLDDDSLEESKAGGGHLLLAVAGAAAALSQQPTPSCAHKDPNGASFPSGEDEPASNTSKPVSRELQPSFSNSFEEDGLLAPHDRIAAAALLKKESTPKKVQFNTTPEDGTPIDDEVDKENPPYPQETKFPVAPFDTPEEVAATPLDKQPEAVANDAESSAPIGWVPTDSPIPDDPNKDQPDNKTETPAKIMFPPPPVSPTSDESDASSEPEITEYSFETGPSNPANAIVLANEMGSYEDPPVTSIAVRVSSPTDEMNVLGTPPRTPPAEKEDLVIGNPQAEEESPRTRTGSTSSSISSTSTSSSSTNGSYRIQNGDTSTVPSIVVSKSDN